MRFPKICRPKAERQRVNLFQNSECSERNSSVFFGSEIKNNVFTDEITDEEEFDTAETTDLNDNVPIPGRDVRDRNKPKENYRENEQESEPKKEENNGSKENVENMEKTRADILIEKSKKSYYSAVQVITDLYDNVFSKDSGFKYDKRGILSEYDEYLQAVLIKICSIRNRFLSDEMRFIENISDYGKLLDGADYTLFAGCVKDMSDRLTERADEKLKTVPVCFKLAGAMDASKGTTSMRVLLDNTVKIAFNLKFIDPEADLKDNSDVIAALKAVYSFAKFNGISLK